MFYPEEKHDASNDTCGEESRFPKSTYSRFLTEAIKEGHESQLQRLRHAESVDHTKQGKTTTATPERLKHCAHARFKTLYIS